MKEVNIYTVSGIRGRWQQDGYVGYVLEYYPEGRKYPEIRKEIVPVQQMNENRSELEVLIMAMRRMKEKCIITVYTQSRYLYCGYEDAEYVKSWKENSWMKKDGKEVKNRDKWQELDRLMQGNLIRFFLGESNAYTGDLLEEIKKTEE